MTSAPSSMLVRKLGSKEPIPFDLLLLADETLEAINKYLPDAEIYVGELGDLIISTFVLKAIDDEQIEIKNIAVAERFQRQGLGTQLLDHATEIALRRNFKYLLIGTGDHSYPQLGLYEKNGFQRFRVIKNFFINNYPTPIIENDQQLVDMIILRKQLRNVSEVATRPVTDDT